MEKVTDEVLELVKSKILSYSGIYLAKSQEASLAAHILKKASEKGQGPKDYCQELSVYTPDFDEIVNLVTVNETYFFREERQFDYLKKEVFPKYMGKNLTIWTCCCSTGEEPVSLLALALSMNVNLTIYASDIDDNALAYLKNGKYSLFSLRSDGKKYHHLLEAYSSIIDNKIVFNRNFINRIHAFKFNLIQDGLDKLPFFENVDILFMRNVFIYFDKPTRNLVTKKITERLKCDGLLFFSMNEIGSMDDSVIPKELYKTNCGCVYFFVKTNSARNSIQIAAEANRRLKEKEAAYKKEKLRTEVQKVKIQKFADYNDSLREAKNALEASVKDISFDAKKIYEDICMEINRGDFEKARAIVNKINGRDTKKYLYFMQGYVEYHADNRAEAEMLFANAESISPDFWPAFFYHGMVLRDLGKSKNANGCFSKCKQLITDFGDELPYDFTLDSFSPSYIYSLCETFSTEGGV